MSWLNWLSWLLGISSTLAIVVAVALAFLAPSVLVGIMEFLKPWLKLLGEASAGLVRRIGKILKVSIPDLLSPWQTFLTYFASIALAALAGYWYASVDKCPPVDPSLRVDYKLIKRTSKEREDYLKRIGKTEWNVFWEKWF